MRPRSCRPAGSRAFRFSRASRVRRGRGRSIFVPPAVVVCASAPRSFAGGEMKKIVSCGPHAGAALLLVLLLLPLARALPAAAQTAARAGAGGSSLAGRVTDPQGAGVAGA